MTNDQHDTTTTDQHPESDENPPAVTNNPIDTTVEEEDDDFGDFVESTTTDPIIGNDSLPSPPQQQKKESTEEVFSDPLLGNLQTSVTNTNDAITDQNISSNNASTSAAEDSGQLSSQSYSNEVRDEGNTETKDDNGVPAATDNHQSSSSSSIDNNNNEEFLSTRTEESNIIEDNGDALSTLNENNIEKTAVDTVDNDDMEASDDDGKKDISTELQEESFGDFADADEPIITQNETETIATANAMVAQERDLTNPKEYSVETEHPHPGFEMDAVVNVVEKEDLADAEDEEPNSKMDEIASTIMQDNLHPGAITDSATEKMDAVVNVVEKEDLADAEDEEPNSKVDEIASTIMQENLNPDAITDSATEVAGQTAQDIDNGDHDDFGDFDAAPIDSGVKNHDADEEDDFGDFDAAPINEHADKDADKSQQQNNEPMKMDSAPNEIASDDDFGDFDAVQQVTNDVDDDFGDFDEAPTNDSNNEPLNANVTTSSYIDPVVGKANAIMPIIFAKYGPKKVDCAEDAAPQTIPEVESIESILASFGERKFEFPNEEERIQMLRKYLDKHQSEEISPPTLIISKGAKGPFAHFYYPTGGFPQLKKSNSATSSSWSAYLPESYNSFPSDPSPASITSRQQSRPISSTSSTTPESKVNQVSKKSGHQENGSMDRVKEFLSRVPDLSYMLSTKLSIPEGS